MYGTDLYSKYLGVSARCHASAVQGNLVVGVEKALVRQTSPDIENSTAPHTPGGGSLGGAGIWTPFWISPPAAGCLSALFAKGVDMSIRSLEVAKHNLNERAVMVSAKQNKAPTNLAAVAEMPTRNFFRQCLS